MSAVGLTPLPGTAHSRLINALERAGCKHKGQMWACPAHDDHNPSLSVKEGKEGVLIRCHVGCKTEDVVTAVGLTMADLFDRPRSEKFSIPRNRVLPRNSRQRSAKPIGEDQGTPPKRVAEYNYETANGDLLRRKVRLEPGTNGRSKSFIWEMPDRDDWSRCKENGNPKVLYALPLVSEADVVHINEGEKAADTLNQYFAGHNQADHAATCAPTPTWEPSYTEALQGKRVVLWVDRDEPGEGKAVKVYAELVRAGFSVKTVRARSPAAQADAFDHIEAGYTPEDGEPFTLDLETVGPEFEPFSALSGAEVPELPGDVLPDWLSDFVEAQAVATQTPRDLVAMLGIAAIATAIAPKARVRVKPGYTEPLNLYIGVALPPGERKSAVFAAASKPLIEYETKLSEDTAPEVMRSRENRELMRDRVAKARKLAINASGDKFQKARSDMADAQRELIEAEGQLLHWPRIIVDDVTPERLSSLLKEQGGTLATWSPEGGELFELFRGRYSSNGRPNIGVYLKAHSGDALVVDRVSSEPIRIDSPALTIATAIQPAAISELGGDTVFRERGLIARFLFSIPKPRAGKRDSRAKPAPEAVVSGYGIKLRDLMEIKTGGERETINLSAEALELWHLFDEELEPRRGEGGDLEGIADWANKLSGAVARIAGLLHAGELVSTAPWTSPIAGPTMERAIRLGRYLIGHALCAFGSMVLGRDGAGALKVWRWISTHELTEFQKSELWQGVKNGRFACAKDLDSALRLLVSRGYLAPIEAEDSSSRSGPKPERYAVNPAAFDHDAKYLGQL